ncbi:MAG: hypothetical protein ACUX7D_07700 [Candidatus Methanodesulfokora washburnensis]|jgi:hypothetical protein
MWREVDKIASKALSSLDLVSSRAVILYGNLPDEIAAAVMIYEMLKARGVEVFAIPSLPEEFLENVERSGSSDLIAVGVLPTGPGPLDVAEKLHENVFLFSDSISHGHGISLIDGGLGIPLSCLSYRMAIQLGDEDLSDLCWIAAIGSMDSYLFLDIAREAALKWPYIFASSDGENFRRGNDILVKASLLHPVGPSLAFISLDENMDDPASFLDGSSILSSFLKNEGMEGSLRDLISSSGTLRLSKEGLRIWEASETRKRRAIAYFESRASDDLVLSYATEGPVAFVSARRSSSKDLLSEMKEKLSGIEHSICGGIDHAEITMRSSQIDRFIERLGE